MFTHPRRGDGLKLVSTGLGLGMTDDSGLGKSEGFRCDVVENVVLGLRGFKRVTMVKPEDADRCYLREEKEEGDLVDDVELEGGGRGGGEMEYGKMKVQELRDECTERGVDSKGVKRELVER